MAASTPTPASAHAPQHVHPSVEEQVIRQVEWYMGRQNLVRDFYLKSKMDADFWVSLDIIVAFPKMQAIGLSDPAVVAALLARGSQTVEVDTAGNRIRPAWAKRSVLALTSVPLDTPVSAVDALFTKSPTTPRPVSIMPVPDREGLWHAVFENPDDAGIALDYVKDLTIGNTTPPTKVTAHVFLAYDHTQAFPGDFGNGVIPGAMGPLGAPQAIGTGFYDPSLAGPNGSMPLHPAYAGGLSGGVMPAAMAGLSLSSHGPPQAGNASFGYVPGSPYGPGTVGATGYGPTSPGYGAGGRRGYDAPGTQFYGSPYGPQGSFDPNAPGGQHGTPQATNSGSGASRTNQMEKAAAAAAAAAIAGARAGNVNPGGFSSHLPPNGHPVPIAGSTLSGGIRMGSGVLSPNGSSVAGTDGIQANGARGRQNRQSQRHGYHSQHSAGAGGVHSHVQGRYQGPHGTEGVGVRNGPHVHAARSHNGSALPSEFINSAAGAGKGHVHAVSGRKIHTGNGFGNGGVGTFIEGSAGRGAKMPSTVGDVMSRPHAAGKKHKKRANAGRFGGTGSTPGALAHIPSQAGSVEGRAGFEADSSRDDSRRSAYDDGKKFATDERKSSKGEPNVTAMYFPPLPGSNAEGAADGKSSGSEAVDTLGSNPPQSTESVSRAPNAFSHRSSKTAADVLTSNGSKSPDSHSSCAASEEKDQIIGDAARAASGSNDGSETDTPANMDDASDSGAQASATPTADKIACVSDVSSNVSSCSGGNGATAAPTGSVGNSTVSGGEKAPIESSNTTTVSSGMSYAAILRAKVKKPVQTPAPVSPASHAEKPESAAPQQDAKGHGTKSISSGNDGKNGKQTAAASASSVSSGRGGSASKADVVGDVNSAKDGQSSIKANVAKKDSGTPVVAGLPAARAVWANKPQSVLQAAAVVRSIPSKSSVTSSTPSSTVIQNPSVSPDSVSPSSQLAGAPGSTARPAVMMNGSSANGVLAGGTEKVATVGSTVPSNDSLKTNTVDSSVGIGSTDGSRVEHAKKVGSVDRVVSGGKGAWGQSQKVWSKELASAEKVSAKSGSQARNA